MGKNDNFLLFFYYVKYSSVIISQKGLYQIFSNLSFSNKWTGWWWNQLKLLLEQTFSPVASSGHPCVVINSGTNREAYYHGNYWLQL